LFQETTWKKLFPATGAGIKRSSQIYNKEILNKPMETDTKNVTLANLEKQVLSVVEGIKRNPNKRKQILVGYITHVYEAVKEAIRKNGSVLPHYVILSDRPGFGAHCVTDEVIEKAKAMNAEAVVSVEGFESRNDITDVVYHVSMSAPALGALGWVLKVKLKDGAAAIRAEKPYLFDLEEKVKTLGQLVNELEADADK
jgi:hypothetical protein